MDRREELRRATRPRRPPVRRVTRQEIDPRRAELLKAFGVKRYRPGDRVDLLHRGKIIGPPWMGGIFQTRLNWGTLVLAFGVVLFIVWLIMRAQVG